MGHRSTQCFPQCLGECFTECFTQCFSQCLGECFTQSFTQSLGECIPQCLGKCFTQRFPQCLGECIPQCFTQCLGECILQCFPQLSTQCWGELCAGRSPPTATRRPALTSSFCLLSSDFAAHPPITPIPPIVVLKPDSSCLSALVLNLGISSLFRASAFELGYFCLAPRPLDHISLDTRPCRTTIRVT